VIKVLFLQVILIIFSKYLYFTAKIIIRALHQLELTYLSMSLQILSLDFAAAFVITLYDFTEAPIVMRLQVLVNYYCLATQVLTLDPSEVASYFVGFHFAAL